MNRKETSEQNDISIIIRNLPKRLQDKLITREASGNSSIKNDKTSDTVSAKNNGCEANVKILSGKKICDVPDTHEAHTLRADAPFCNPEEGGSDANEINNKLISADNIFHLTAEKENGRNVDKVKPVSEASGPKSLSKEKLSENQTKVVVPGLIRFNAEDAKKFTECSNHDLKNGLRNHDRRHRHQTRQEIVSSKFDFPMSPVRHIQKQTHPHWFEALDNDNSKRLPALFETLQNAMSHNLIIKNWVKLSNVRQDLQNIFKNLILHNIKFCCEQKVDSFFWKILFYNMREHLKQQDSCNAIDYVNEIITEGMKFYEDLYQMLCKQYLSKEAQLKGNDTQSSTSNRSQHKMNLMVKVMAQKLLIYLGDLWRYKIKDGNGQDYAEAEKYYKKAQSLVPSNGVPYNQLAIISIHNREKLDAIYYYMRSLMSSNAIHSAKESLLILFDELRKKYEETEIKSPIHSNYSNNNQQSSKSMRKEVWICPDGVRRLHQTDIVNEEKRYKEMAKEELLRRLISLYIYIIGKLYTGIGMDTIIENQRKLLLQLSVLLQIEPFTISRIRLMKMLALNIFTVEHNLDKGTRRYHALNFCNQIFGLLLHKSNELLHNLNTNPEEFEDENFLDLNTTLQFHRIYMLWLQRHVNIWEPFKNEGHIFINTWLELENFFKVLQQEVFDVNQLSNVTFEEDIFFMGFTPLISIIPKTKRDTVSEESLQLKARIKELLDLEEFYMTNQKQLENDPHSNFVTEDLNSDIKQALDDLESTHLTKVENVITADKTGDAGNDKNIIENIVNSGKKSPMKRSLNLCLTSKTDDMQLSQLSKLKKELEAKTNATKMYHKKLEEILKFVDSKVYIEVRPKYLLPDTNCFIDCLEDFERIVYEFERYTLIVPLTVVKELDGLSKGVKLEFFEKSLQKQRIHHYDDVSSRAKKSLDFIRTAKSHVKFATTKGSIINASLFALVEEENLSNDDKILATAIALSKTMSSTTSKDGKCFIQTELVLITTDRNLRVKALSRNLAVSDLPEFLQWAKDCN